MRKLHAATRRIWGTIFSPDERDFPAKIRPGSFSTSPDVVILEKPFVSRGGHSWSSEMPAFLCGDGIQKRRVAYRLFEDDALVTAHSNANHVDIVAMGGGLHAYWTDLFCFSTSDNTDPNSNGRGYTLRRISDATLGLWPFGGCTIWDPSYALEMPGLGFVCPRHTGYSASPYTHTTGEHLQLIEFLRGAFDFPPELRRFCNTEFTRRPGGFEATLKDLDVILVEQCSNVEMVFRDIVLNRLRLADTIVTPTIAAADAVGDGGSANAARNWYYDGLIKGSPRREEYAAKILTLMPQEGKDSELLRAIVREVKPRQIQPEVFIDGIKRISSLLGKPVGVLTHTQHYMPDGRPVSWPPTLHDDIMGACLANGIMFMHPGELVTKYGVRMALKEDLTHWRDDFMPVVAKAMDNFARQVLAGSP